VSLSLHLQSSFIHRLGIFVDCSSGILSVPYGRVALGFIFTAIQTGCPSGQGSQDPTGGIV
jgi:hypothetical protein